MKPATGHTILKGLVMAIFSALAATAAVPARAAKPLESSVNKPPATEPLPTMSEYEVQSGEVLGTIALSHGIRLEELMEANAISNPDQVFAGQKLKIPGDPESGVLTKQGVVLKVPRNFTLSRIAAAYKVPARKIIAANKLKNPDRLRENQKLLIPGAKFVVKLVPPPPCFKAPVSLYRVRNDNSRSLPLCYCDGRPNPEAVDVLSTMSAPLSMQAPFPLHPRLLKLLQLIVDAFPGRRIEIISGQRVAKRPDHESYHSKGQALDFRVEGIANKKLVDFVKKFDEVGVGYYPNSVFIHMDTRDRKAYWIDYSAPGEKPIYGQVGMTSEEVEQIRARRAQLTSEPKGESTDSPAAKPEQST